MRISQEDLICLKEAVNLLYSASNMGIINHRYISIIGKLSTLYP